jgi:hypothetical protein
MDADSKKHAEFHLSKIRQQALGNPNQDEAQMQIIILMEKALGAFTLDPEEDEFLYRGLKEILKELYKIEDKLA